MVALYLFTLILGGGFLALSIFGDLLGGHGDVDGDLGGMDGHLELDAGGLDLDAGGVDLDAGGLDMDLAGGDADVAGLDLDADGLDVDGHLDLDVGHADLEVTHAELQADAGSLAAKIFSIRTAFYSMFGFGAMGTLLTYAWSGNPFVTAAVSLLAGFTSGSIVNAAFSYVRRTESGMVQSELTYEGCPGRVTLPLRFESPGKVVVERFGRRVELRALPHPSMAGKGDPSEWRKVFVVEMVRGVARVAPIEEDMLLEP